jgi:hypothetical protein
VVILVSHLLKEKKDILILVPAIIAFCLAMIPVLKFQWPLSWDIFYHIHLSELYLENGFTLWDGLTYAPYGRPIFYAPLFHVLLLSLSKIFGLNLFDTARYIQPVLASLIVLSFSYVAFKLYNLTTGFLTGIFVLFSQFYYRMILPIPEAMAMIFLPLIMYFYYCALEHKDYKYAAVAGILMGLAALTHMLSAGMILICLIIFTIVLKSMKKELSLKYFLVFLGVALLIAAIWWVPLLITYGYSFKSPPAEGLTLSQFKNLFGIIPLLFALMGLSFFLKRRENRDIMVISWLVAMMAVSMTYILGIKVLSVRILTFAVFPMMLLAAAGVQCIRFKDDKRPMYALIAVIMIFGVYTGYSTANASQITVTDSQIGVAHWFQDHGDKERVAVIYNYEIDPVIVAISRQPVSAGGYFPGAIKAMDISKYVGGTFTKEDILVDNVGYIVLDTDAKTPPFATLVYQNKDYKIFELQKFK